MTADDLIHAVKLFLEFLEETEYPHPVWLAALMDPDTGHCEKLNRASIDAVLADFREWLHEGDELSLVPGDDL